VTVDGARVQPAPVVVEGLSLRAPHTVEVTAPGRRGVTRTGALDLWNPHARIPTALPPALGTLLLDSEPPNAEVRFDGRPLGRTPLAIPDVALGERHRVDLTHPGREIDQFVVLPERDGTSVKRTLVPARPPPAARPARE
jgi:hypothetical protein